MERQTQNKGDGLYLYKGNPGAARKLLGQIEDLFERYEIDDLEDLNERLSTYKFLANHDYSTMPRIDLVTMIDSLKQYKAIEEKWGIELSVVDEALEKGIYAECSDGKIRHFEYVHIFKEIDEYWIYTFNSDWKFQTVLRDFGDEWALSEEALK